MATDPVELLLGAEICSSIFKDGLRKGRPQAPMAQNTILGWILSEDCSVATLHSHPSSLQCIADHNLTTMVCRFWEQEEVPLAPTALAPEEERCENFFVQTHTRTSDGRYVVRLPFATTPGNLEETRKPAERLLTAMERKSSRDSRFGDLYRSFMLEYEQLKHMSEINEGSTANDTDNRICYLPHHGVLRESSTTTKLRVVFNGSQRIQSGESLNTQLIVGANLLPALADVLRWRWHRYAIVADIEKMYHQILVHPDDHNFQRVLWRRDNTREAREYRLNTVTYGLACAPFLAIRTLRQLADDEESRFPLGAAALRRNCYVDDIVSGANTLSEAATLQRELRELCMAGGFPLRKWASNCEETLTGVPQEHRLLKAQHTWKDELHPTLGLRWHSRNDHFAFAIQPRTMTEYTKRRVLAETTRLFDPLGWLAPTIIRAKILIQSAWLQGLDWDAPLPPADTQQWRLLLEELPQLEHMRVHRWLRTGEEASTLQIHGFADASERGYAAAVYLRTVTDGTATIHLLAAKSKVAPIKQISLPRLELCAASLLVTLTHHLCIVLSFCSAHISMVRLQGHPLLDPRTRLKVENVRGQPSCPDSDAASEGPMETRTWTRKSGRLCVKRNSSQRASASSTSPAWLRKDEHCWPERNLEAPKGEMPEKRATTHHAAANVETEPETLLRCSSLHRLLRVTAWCLRWRRSTARERLPSDATLEPVLKPAELDEALHRWLRVVQSLHYADEIAAISVNRIVAHRTPLSRLNPFMDHNGVLRVGGRLKHAILSNDERHPMITPSTSWLTPLLVDSCHQRTLHGGV